MLTRRDQPVEHGLETFELVKSLKTKHIGFKDVGADRATPEELNRYIKVSGAASYTKVVSTTFEYRMTSRRSARAIGVKRLIGSIGSPARVLGLRPVPSLREQARGLSGHGEPKIQSE